MQVTDIVSTALRKSKGGNLTAGQIKQHDGLQNILRHDEGFTILKNLGSSPPYFQAKQKELFAIIGQLGMPTFFATFSAAETRWLDSLALLNNKHNDHNITPAEAAKMTWMERADLINKDPVTCVRQYRRFSIPLSSVPHKHPPVVFFTYWTGSGSLHKGRVPTKRSPHLHCVFWVKDAPAYGSSLEKDVINFIDKNISCSSDDEDEEKEFIALQTHKHTKTCQKMGKKICRFGFPIPPMRQAMILKPLESDTPKEIVKNKQNNLQKIRSVMQSLVKDEDMPFIDFLKKCDLSDETYILVIRSVCT